MTNENSTDNLKCVMGIDNRLPAGLIANTAAILGISLGRNMPQVVGADVHDQDGGLHPGIIEFPVPILKGPPEEIQALRKKLGQPEYGGLFFLDFTDLAQGCRTYDEFVRKMAGTAGDELRYLGIAVCGDKRKVSRLTGHMGLLK